MTDTISPNPIKTISVEQEMRNSYMEYAMSVIVSRALPDVRDGLKPVHRRILYAMEEGGYTPGKPYRKSARIVGDVMGKYHPHGDAAIYDTMVRMAQNFSMRVPLIDGQGNFGSLDGDPPAAMRYTEARMARAAQEMTVDIDLGTVDFRPTYDNSDSEPVVLPTRIPNLLVNGGTGIAVGMATNIPPHNLGEVIAAMLVYMDRPDMSVVELMEHLPGPDFPTGGVILGRSGIKEAYETGRGSITISGVAHIEEAKRGNRSRIVITELPYALNKATFQERIAELVNTKVIEGISEVRDESDRDESVRVVLELKRDADPDIVLNKIKKHTRFVDTFGVNAVCLDSRGNPVTMGLRQIFGEFIDFRRQVIRRRTIFELNRARDNLHRQIGLYAAVSRIDDVVRTIRQSPDVDVARRRLMEMDFPTEGEFAQLLREADPDLESVAEVFHLSDIQASAILELSLRRLTGMERDRIAERARDLSSEIQRLVAILNDPLLLDSILKQELVEVKEKYGSDRLTQIEAGEYDALSDDDLVPRRDVVMTLTRKGYVKITPLEAYREQHRGGKGKSGMDITDDDVVTTSLVCTTRTPLVFVTTRGIAHSLKAYRLPEMAANARGRPIVNLLESMRVNEGETIAAVLAMPENNSDLEGRSIIFVTDFGDVRRNEAADFASIQRNGKIAIRLEDDNGQSIGKLVSAFLCDSEDDVFLATRKGMSIRFRVDDLRIFRSRTSTGVRGIQLAKDDCVIGAALLNANPYSAEERLAYLAGGEYSDTQTMDDMDEGALADEAHPWGTISYVRDVHPEQGHPILRRKVALSAEHMERMRADERLILTVSEKGYGKRSSSYEFRTIGRGGKGLNCMNINRATGGLVAAFPVKEEDGLVMITDSGQTIRTRVADVRVQGRTTRGVILFRLPDDQKVVATTRVPSDEEAGGEE